MLQPKVDCTSKAKAGQCLSRAPYPKGILSIQTDLGIAGDLPINVQKAFFQSSLQYVTDKKSHTTFELSSKAQVRNLLIWDGNMTLRKQRF